MRYEVYEHKKVCEFYTENNNLPIRIQLRTEYGPAESTRSIINHPSLCVAYCIGFAILPSVTLGRILVVAV